MIEIESDFIWSNLLRSFKYMTDSSGLTYYRRWSVVGLIAYGLIRRKNSTGDDDTEAKKKKRMCRIRALTDGDGKKYVTAFVKRI